MTERHGADDFDLERFFRAARAQAPAPSDAFVARLTAQAETLHCAAIDRPLPRARAVRPGALARLVAAIGGWASFGGMVTAACAGLWIGVAGTPALMQAVGAGTAAQAVAETDYFADADVLALALID